MTARALHQVRTIMAYRAMGAKFYVPYGCKWVHVGDKRFYAAHYRMALGMERTLRKLRSQAIGAQRWQRLAHVKGILSMHGRKVADVLNRMKKAIKR